MNERRQTIIGRPDVAPAPRLLSRELTHVRQWSRRPLTFPFRYLWHHIRPSCQRNPYLVDTRAAEGSHGDDHGA